MMTMNQIAAMAKQIMLRDGYHAPTLIAEGSTDRRVLWLKEFPDDSQQRQAAMEDAGRNVGQRAGFGELIRVFLISEAWVSIPTGGKLPSIPPSKDPQRREVLIVSSVAVDRTTAMTIFHIERDATGNVSGLTEFSPSPTANLTMQSPLLDAFLHGFTQARKRAA